MGGSHSITPDDIKNKHIYELKDDTDKSYSNYVSIERKALQELFQILYDDYKYCKHCKICDAVLIRPEIPACQICKEKDTCKKCLVSCNFDPTHKVHAECLISCHVCNDNVCSACCISKKLTTNFNNIGVPG